MAPSAAEPTASGAVALPKRKPVAGAEPTPAAAPVWSLEENTNTSSGQPSAAVPLTAKCDVHNRERVVCCRELKGDDERSLIDPDIVRDVIIGLADGLTVPFALTAGLSSLGSSKLVTVAGVAELVSGAISMGVGGYLSAQAERDHFRYQLKTTRERVQRSCAGEMEREVSAILSPLGVEDSISRRVAGALLAVEASLPIPPPPPTIAQQIMRTIARRPKFSAADAPDERAALLPKADENDERGLTSFLLKFGEGMEEVGDGRLFISAFTIGMAYFLGGLVPLLPYFFIPTAGDALWVSVAITTVVLLVFGGFKQYFTGATVGFHGYAYGCISTFLVGGAAAAASFGIVRALEGAGGSGSP